MLCHVYENTTNTESGLSLYYSTFADNINSIRSQQEGSVGVGAAWFFWCFGFEMRRTRRTAKSGQRADREDSARTINRTKKQHCFQADLVTAMLNA